MIKIEEYIDENGNCPFRVWLAAVPTAFRARIQARIFRFQSGNLGDCKSVGGGVHEARIHSGPGFRVYFWRSGQRLVILLLGGTKGSQSRDIKNAKILWEDWREVTLDD